LHGLNASPKGLNSTGLDRVDKSDRPPELVAQVRVLPEALRISGLSDLSAESLVTGLTQN
jgi:hypothetical protein